MLSGYLYKQGYFLTNFRLAPPLTTLVASGSIHSSTIPTDHDKMNEYIVIFVAAALSK